MRMVEGVTLGRVIITKLPPGKKITPHVDGGAPATYFSRYQIALQSLPGALFTIGDETVNFESGEVWLIDNKKEHSVVNNSRDDRIVMIVDIRS
jgi:aspartyl/asparaginyl beta-hydroxylase (cupin superfamily)